MNIDGINKVSGAYNVSKPQQTSKTARTGATDSVKISGDAKRVAETARYIEIVKNSPDIRTDKVEQAKKNLASYMQGSKIDNKVLDKIIDRLMDTVLG